MAEDRAALLDEANRRGLLPPDMASAYAEAKKRDLIKPGGVMERLGTGFMDPVYGAAQIGARMTEEGFSADPEASEAQRQERIQTVDTAVKEREKSIESKRPESQRGSTDWLRAAGSAPSTIALTAPLSVFGGIPGAVAAGAAIQPTTDTEHFGSEKAKASVVGGVFGGAIGAGAKAAGAGVRALGDWLAREYPENVMTQAVKKILKRMGQDQAAGGPTATQAIDLINEANQIGPGASHKPVTLTDVGGENVKALAGNVARQSGESRNITRSFLEERDQGAAPRIQADIDQYIHGGPSMHQTTQALIEARSAEARPLWNEVRQMQGVWSPRLQQFVEDPSIRAGMARGYEIERLESLAENRPFDPTQMGVDLDNEGNIRMIQSPNMRVLHMGKMGLDAMIADERNEITGRLSQRGVALDRVRRAYLNEIDSLDRTGIYRQARQAWEGPSASMDAVRAGRAAFTSSPEEIAEEFNGLSPANQEFYRIGVADNIRERLMKTGVSGDEAKAIIKNPWMRDQMRPIFRSEADFNGFVDAVTHEGNMFRTNTETLGGPATARRIAEDTSAENAMAGHGMHLAEQTATGSWIGAAKTAIRMWRDRQDAKGNPRLNEQISRILFQTPIDPASELGQRLTGQFTGPAGVNRLGTAADVVGQSPLVLAPGAGSALAQPTQ